MTVATLTGAVAPDPPYLPEHPLPELHAAIGTALAALSKRHDKIKRRWAYYDGEQPQLWLTEAFRRAFGRTFPDQLGDNYCALAVDAVVARLEVVSWQPSATAPAPASEEEPDAGQLAAAAWADNNLDLEQEEVYRAAEVAGEAYVIVWPRQDDDGNQLTGPSGAPLWDVVLNDARNVYLHTGSSRRDRRYAVKVWKDDTGKCWRATVYYGTEVARLRTRDLNTGGASWPSKPSTFYLDPEDSGGTTPWSNGRVMVFRFARDRAGRSRLDRLFAVQDKLNKLAANKMVTAEFAAWPQRYLLTGQDVPDEALRFSPATVLKLDPGGGTDGDGPLPQAQVGQFEAAQLENYDKAYDAEARKLFTLAPLPRHLMVNPGVAPSGEAVRADEGPFVSTLTDCTQMYGASWADVAELMGIPAVPVWADLEVANGEATARELLLLTQAGVPIEAALRQVNRADEETLAALAAARATAAVAQRAADSGLSAEEVLAEGLVDVAGGGGGGGGVVVEDPDDLAKKANALGQLIRAGVEPGDAAKRVGLEGVRFTGAVPVSLRLPEDDAGKLEAT